MAARLNKGIKKPKELTDWTREETIAKLGRLSDGEVARELGITRARVQQVRSKLGIAKRPPDDESMPAAVYELLGAERDSVLAQRFGVRVEHVRKARKKRNIPPFRSPCGTRTRYNQGCRCTLCREVNTVSMRARNEKLRGERKRDYPKPWTALHADGTPKKLEDLPEAARMRAPGIGPRED